VRTKGRKNEEIEYNSALFALLRQKRKEIADEAGVPPYVIFSDKTLAEMAAYYPQSFGSLLKISGVGQVKLRQYGEVFLEIIQAYCEKHDLQEKPKEVTREKSDTNRRYMMVAEAFNSGETIQNLMERYHVTVGTILEHLSRYLSAGNKLRNGEDLQALASVTLEQQQTAFAAFDELSPTFLKPVYDKLNGTLNYEDLKILRLLYLISTSA
ncbi:MAG TPA: HRDC domain-containing protein, partial [Anaerolineales bacterium]